MAFILQWIDLIFLPVALFVVRKDQRLITAVFMISCMFMMRLQVELMLSTGYWAGFLGLMKMDVHSRGQITYSIFYVFYIILTIFSPNTKSWILLAGGISIFFAAFFTSSLIMLL